MSQKTRIVFVCLGNIVRSPLAENMFRHLAEETGASREYQLDSAGTGAYHVGEAPDSRMRRVAAQRGLKYSGRARQFKRADFDRFDLIIAMDRSNRSNLQRLARTEAEREKIRLMREFDPSSSPQADVPDPYYGGMRGFEDVYDIVARACQGLLETLESGELA